MRKILQFFFFHVNPLYRYFQQLGESTLQSLNPYVEFDKRMMMVMIVMLMMVVMMMMKKNIESALFHNRREFSYMQSVC